MKRRSQTATHSVMKLSKSNAKTQSRLTHKVKNAKSRHQKPQKSQKNNKKIVQDYLMIDGNIYKANTVTEREQVSQFVNRFKRQAIYQKPPKSKHQCQFSFEQKKQQTQKSSQIPVEQMVKKLPLQQKLTLMKQLQKQLGNNPELLASGNSQIQNKQEQTQDDSSQKYNLLNVKLNFLQEQLNAKRQGQIQKINKLFYDGQLTASERKNKILDIDKNKGRKIKIINCTRSLFYTLLHNKFEPEFLKNNNIDEAIKQLDSFSDLDTIQNQYSVRSNKYKVQTGGNSQSSIQSEVEFEKEIHHQKCCEQLKYEDRVDTSDKKSANQDSLLISPDKGAQKSDRSNQSDRFQCSQQSLTKKLKIPLLLTKQKIEQMQWQKKAKAAQKMRGEIDKKIAFQMSEAQVEEYKNHFTTLADLNSYIVSLYEYIIKTDLQRVVQKLNFPYGKSICDKLFFLQQSGQIDQTQYYPVLEQFHLNGYNMEMALTVRRFSDQEKIHNKAVFDCFNMNLNAYRPYYDLEGDVYPWSVSQKGITFYQISEENIEEVFEKTKIKVLQYSSSLCGLIPIGMDISQCPEMIKQKNNQLFQKQEKLALIEQFGKWNIKITDYDAMVRLLITEQILFRQMTNFTKQLHQLQNN